MSRLLDNDLDRLPAGFGDHISDFDRLSHAHADILQLRISRYKIRPLTLRPNLDILPVTKCSRLSDNRRPRAGSRRPYRRSLWRINIDALVFLPATIFIKRSGDTGRSRV